MAKKILNEVKQPRIVNIIGTAPSLGAYKPIYGENWVINHAWKYGTRVDVWFAIEGWKEMVQASRSLLVGEAEFLKFCRNYKGKIYGFRGEKMFDEKNNETIAESEGLPIQELRCLAGTYFTSSIAWCFAMVALQEKLGNKKVDIVNLYGIELWISHDLSEYSEQTECVNYWIAYLNGLGIQVNIPAYLLMAVQSKNSNIYGF